VLAFTKPLNLTLNRFPGGNFTSTYRWEDGIGPKNARPKRPEVAWRSIEPNQFGLDEFAKWSKLNHSDVMMTVNLATRGVLEAMDCLEYCNFSGGTYWSDKRIENGFEQPLGYKFWCLSNELDGIWQVGQTPPYEYGLKAKEASKGMKMLDGSIKTVLAGSSSPSQKTFPHYDATALNECYDFVDYLSVHQYLSNTTNDLPNFLAKPISTNAYLENAAAAIQYIKAKKRSSHNVTLSFDEFNTWHGVALSDEERFPVQWTVGPALLEDNYDTADALVLGGMLLAVLRHADSVKIACMSELMNCISHLRTRNGGGAWVLPGYYAFLHYSQYGRGTALRTQVESETYSTVDFPAAPYLDAQAVLADDKTISLFAINRSLDDSLALEMSLYGFDSYAIDEHIVLTADDPKATNTEQNPNAVAPKATEGAKIADGKLTAVLEKMSWNVITLKPKG
jgi:alpha-N-arabinofuranosidase